MCFAQSRICIFGWRRADCAAKPIATIAIRQRCHSKQTPSVPRSRRCVYPWENHPGPDQVVEVMPAYCGVRLKLPFRLNHVNIYLLADGDGWAMVDAGFGNEESIAPGRRCSRARWLTSTSRRLIVTHSHPDHVGLAG